MERLQKIDSLYSPMCGCQYRSSEIIDKLADYKLNGMTKGHWYTTALIIEFFAEKKEMNVFPNYIEKILYWDEVKEGFKKNSSFETSITETIKKRLEYEKSKKTKDEKAIKEMEQKKCPGKGLMETIHDTKNELTESEKRIKSIENALKELQS